MSDQKNIEELTEEEREARKDRFVATEDQFRIIPREQVEAEKADEA